MEHAQPADRQLDKNDVALMRYFSAGMRRFTKFVTAETQAAATVEARIEAAYRSAYTQFVSDQQKGQQSWNTHD